MSDDKKSSRKSSPQPDKVEPPISKVVQISASEIVAGTKLLYPGGKLIAVKSAELYTPFSNVFKSEDDVFGLSLVVLRFEGQPDTAFVAIPPLQKVFVYAD